MRLALLFFFVASLSAQAQLFQKREIALPFKVTKDSRMNWADFDSNGDLDLLINGDSLNYTSIFFFSKNSIIKSTRIEILLDSIPRYAIADLNNDNEIDIVASGFYQGQALTSVYFNSPNLNFSAPTVLDSIYHPEFVIEDFNNDGRKDILPVNNDQYHDTIIIFRNTIKGFIQSNTNIFALGKGVKLSLDFNHDGRNDIFYYGEDSTGKRVNTFYKNRGNLKFEKINLFRDSLHINNASLIDINADGYDDILLNIKEGSSYANKIYLYYPDISMFLPSDMSLKALQANEFFSADFDHNGLSDMMISCDKNSSETINHIYLNKNGILEIYSDTLLDDLAQGQFSMTHFNGDGNIDLFQLSPDTSISFVYLSRADFNAPPHPPVNLQAITTANRTILSWTATSDDNTPVKTLTYEIFIVKNDRMYATGESHLPYGERKVVKKGKAGHANSYIIYGLPNGEYTWGVIAIDNGLSSGWKIKNDTGSICNGTLVINNGAIISEGMGVSCVDILSVDTTICRNQKVVLYSGYEGAPARWYSVANGFIDFNAKLEFIAVENDTIYSVTDRTYGCEKNFSLQLTIGEGQGRKIISDTSVCPGQTLSYQLLGKMKDYSWYLDGNSLDKINDSINFTINKPCILSAVGKSESGCFWSDYANIKFFKQTSLDLEDKEVCVNTNILFTLPSNIKSAKWEIAQQTFNGTSVNISFKEKEEIVVKGKDENGCAVLDTFYVNIFPDYHLSFAPEIFLGSDSFNLDISDLKDYTWKTNAGQVLTPAHFYRPLNNTLIIVEGKDLNGCKATDSLYLSVPEDIYIPSLFSPNNDRINDLFKVYGENFKSLELSITDRNGNTVYHSNDIASLTQVGWDGRLDSDLLPADIYFWHLEGTYINGQPVSYHNQNTGSITLVR